MESQIVCFLDLLGYSNYLKENPVEAYNTLLNYHHVVKTKYIDNELHPIESYEDELKPLAKKTAITSFKDFLPVSDSIFITSICADDFVEQLSHFLYESYYMTMQAYVKPEHDDARKITGTQIIKKEGSVQSCPYITTWYPTLFRGGVTIGDAGFVELFTLESFGCKTVKTLTGPAVAEAVLLEKQGKGPKIFCTKEFSDKLSQNYKKYIYENKRNNTYEILWPMAAFIDGNPFNLEIGNFNNLFTSAYNLWRTFNHTELSIYYFNFMKLIILSTLKFSIYHGENERRMAINHIKRICKALDVADKFTEDMDE